MFLLLLVPQAAVLTGCGRPMMAPPTIFQDGDIDPFFEVSEDQRTSEVTVFYATDRLEDRPGWGNYGRGRSDTLDLGTCTVQFDGPDNWKTLHLLGTGQPRTRRPDVQIPDVNRLGDLYSTRNTPGRATTTDTLDQTAQDFIGQLETALEASSQHEVTIYIHGFKNGFHEGVRTAGEYAHYAGNQGVFIAYSWPSYNSLWKYQHDRDAARFTVTHLRQFVRFLADHSSARKINFICHSSGCQVFGSMLRELRLITHDLPAEQARTRFRIGQVFLVAPDVNVDVARERVLEEGAADLVDHLTVYSSKFDYALRYAANRMYGSPRLGSLRAGELQDADALWLLALDNVTVIDIDRNPTRTQIGHTHQRYNPAISSDILLMLRQDFTPAQRALVRDEGELLWRFCDDYEARIRATARLAYPLLVRPKP